jgi:hypothetical protein
MRYLNKFFDPVAFKEYCLKKLNALENGEDETDMSEDLEIKIEDDE